MAKSDEYSSCLENLRHYETIFFAHLTVYIAINGALLAIFASDKLPQEWVLRTARWAGVITSVVFWVNAEIYLYRMFHFRQRAAVLEPALGYQQYSSMREQSWRRVRPGAWAWRLLFVVALFFWVKSLLLELFLYCR